MGTETSEPQTSKPRLLLISYSDISTDARVLKQVKLASKNWDVTTLGYGPKPADSSEHIEISRTPPPFALDGRKITSKIYPWVYWSLPGVKASLKALAGRSFDKVFANEIDAVPIALKVGAKLGVHADLHEYYPAYYDYQPAWKRRIRPYVEWQCRKFLPRVNSVTAASQGFADLYKRDFGIDAEVVFNAAPYWDLDPTPIHEPLRLVTHGSAHRNRQALNMVEAVKMANTDATLDVYLTPMDPEYIEVLKKAAADEPRIRICDPLPYADLIPTLNSYDVGLHLIPTTHDNLTYAQTNKSMDYVQARIGMIANKQPGTERFVQDYSLGELVVGYEAADFAQAIEALTAEKAWKWKLAADLAAEELRADRIMGPWEAALTL